MASGLDAIPGIQCPLPRARSTAWPTSRTCWGNPIGAVSLKAMTTLPLCFLEEKAVALVPGSGFLAPGHVRLSYALSMEDIQAGMERIREFVKELI